ncbi:NAD(P)H-hydrate dehydratase [Mangrovicoccus sp. HB182678]|uniref:ADP-dependent (S)-NAD(P)H-hydrate dehydratase n=1 Tax=Mangrovicoccus algicola TaxID=2771008 RepID=A0A8J6YTY8_9RHOB|nr:NAD(P)H-hydrate dehydratase [Mangrovicoccus algicola]
MSPALLARLAKRGDRHKYDYGHVLVLAGGVGRGGAARLSARAALRVGAGLVTLAPPPAALIENACQLNAIMLRPVADAAVLREVLRDARISVICLGPGLGAGERSRALVAEVLATGRPAVLDADALGAFAEAPETLFAMLHRRAVLTPHAGEFARLFPAEAEEMRAARDDVTRRRVLYRAAQRAGAVILLKGSVTRIADPGGASAEHAATGDRAAPWLATAGTGDVLAGLISGLLARGFSPMESAQLGAWLHVEAALRVGPGLIAEDLPEAVPEVFRLLGL